MTDETYEICCKRGLHRTECPYAYQYGGHCTECMYVFYIKREPIEDENVKNNENNNSSDG